MNVYSFIFHYLRKTKVLVGIILLSMVIRIISDRYQTYSMAQIIGFLPQYTEDKSVLSNILQYIALLAFLLFSEGVATYIWRYTQGKFLPYFCSLIYKDIFVAVHHHSIRFFNEEMAGKIASKTKNIVSGIRDITGMVLFGLLRPVIGISVSLSLVCGADILLGLIISVLNIIFIIAMVAIRRKVGSWAEKRARFSAEADGAFIDTVTNSELVKSFANYFFEKRSFYHVLKTAVRAEQDERTRDAFYDWESKIIFHSTYLLCCVSIFYFWYLGRLELNGVVLCTSLMLGITNEVMNIGFFAGEFSQAYGQIKDGLTLIYSPCEVIDCDRAHTLNMKGKSINFQNVSFHYPQKSDLFSQFNLRVKSGEKVGLVGHSGSGKSTLIKLLTRYYDIDKGTIIIGGNNIKHVRQESLRAHIAVIPQDTTLFNRTIMENIRYGNINATDEDVIKASKKAYADNFIKELPNGYNSKVGERGVMLSGGERQRIAIARAILKNAPILILDEATSALDSESEQYIQKSLKSLMKGKTVIAIAHRLSTLKEMDRLVVMDNGKIVEEGSHAELLKKRGAYFNFYQIQSLNK